MKKLQFQQLHKVPDSVFNQKGFKHKKIIDRELQESLMYIKNIGILGHADNISAINLLEELADLSTHLKTVYISMSHYLQINDKNTAAKLLGQYMNTSYAYDIGRFLAGWEDIPSDDLLSSIDAYQAMLRDEMITVERNRDELISDLLYFPVVLNCMAVLLNFIYIGYFLEQKELLELFL